MVRQKRNLLTRLSWKPLAENYEDGGAIQEPLEAVAVKALLTL